MASTRKTQSAPPAKSQVYALHSYEFEILTEQIRGTHTRIDGVEARIDSLDKSLNMRIDSLDKSLNARIDGVDKRIDDLRDSMNRGFTTLGIAIAVVGIGLALLQILVK